MVSTVVIVALVVVAMVQVAISAGENHEVAKERRVFNGTKFEYHGNWTGHRGNGTGHRRNWTGHHGNWTGSKSAGGTGGKGVNVTHGKYNGAHKGHLTTTLPLA